MKRATLAVLAFAMATMLSTTTVSAINTHSDIGSTATQARVMPVVVAQSGVYGPYATMRRANEVANSFRSRGYDAIAYHNGDGYYVSVR
jgi:hypothetical protein